MYRSSRLRSTLNTGYITGLGMCEVCTEAVDCVPLWTRVTFPIDWIRQKSSLDIFLENRSICRKYIYLSFVEDSLFFTYFSFFCRKFCLNILFTSDTIYRIDYFLNYFPHRANLTNRLFQIWLLDYFSGSKLRRNFVEVWSKFVMASRSAICKILSCKCTFTMKETWSHLNTNMYMYIYIYICIFGIRNTCYVYI